jgi:hypothetical protein
MTALIRTSISILLLSVTAACTNSYYEIPVETPLQPKLDISDFQRILVVGFLTGGSNEIDANRETARLISSQLRNNSRLQVIDTDIIELTAVAEEQGNFAPLPQQLIDSEQSDSEDEPETLSEEDLEIYEQIFANVNYWRQLGEEFQQPLIITGTIYFTPYERSGMVTREREVYDQFGRRQVVPIRTYRDRKGFILSPKFIFIDGRTGVTLHTERYREEILYDTSQNTPALSSYFELMDRLLPSFLGTLSNESIRGIRILLK